MRKINKGAPLAAFVDCIRDDRPANWDEFSRNYRQVSQDSRLHMLCEEQDSLCGYTELPIEDPFSCHIDHFKKKGMYPLLTFDWNNFIVATMDDDFGARFKDSKINQYDYQEIINPVLVNAEEYFEYPEHDIGNIIPKSTLKQGEQELAEKTIYMFNLRHAALRSRRTGLIKIIEDFRNGGLSSDEIKQTLQGKGFKSLVEQYTKKYQL